MYKNVHIWPDNMTTKRCLQQFPKGILYQNTQYKIRADSHGDLDEESISSKVNCCKTGDLILWRDNLISEARRKNSRFSYDAFCCPTDVFEYLPEDVLDMLIDLYKQNDDTERLKEAMNIKTELWKE